MKDSPQSEVRHGIESLDQSEEKYPRVQVVLFAFLECHFKGEECVGTSAARHKAALSLESVAVPSK